MSIIQKLASSQNRRDEALNQELAKEIILEQNKKAIRELVENLSNKKAIQNDCIKVLYEIGEHAPNLIAPHLNTFISCLDSKNNRLQWGAMTAIFTLTKVCSKEVFTKLPVILTSADKGSVITKDNAINILIELCSIESYSKDAFTLLTEQLLKSPTNQLPMYAERCIPIINNNNKESFIKTLTLRLNDIEKETKRKRVEKVIKKFNK